MIEEKERQAAIVEDQKKMIQKLMKKANAEKQLLSLGAGLIGAVQKNFAKKQFSKDDAFKNKSQDRAKDTSKFTYKTDANDNQIVVPLKFNEVVKCKCSNHA